MHEIKIYGDIVHVTDKKENTVTLLDLQNQLAEAKGEDIKVRLNSDGGDVNEGFAMYYELRRYAKENNAKVSTFAESRLNSIATVIFLAGDKRELSSELQPFVHDARRSDGKTPTEQEQAFLNTINKRIAQHYADHTDLTINEALEMMEHETYIPTEMAKNMRFATDVEEVFRPVALQRFNNNNKQKSDMNKNPKTVSVLAKTIAYIKTLGVVNKILFDATGVEIDFFELADDEIAEVGSKARIDGKDADGSYVMPEGDTYVFVAGELTEIVMKAEDVNEEAVALQAEIDNLTSQLEAVTNASETTITALKAENAKHVAVIANYKNAKSQDAPDDKKDAPKKDDKKEGIASKAIASFINRKPLTTK